MSKKAKQSSSSYTLWAGASPAMIWQKMQLGSVVMLSGCEVGEGVVGGASMYVLNPEKGHGEGASSGGVSGGGGAAGTGAARCCFAVVVVVCVE